MFGYIVANEPELRIREFRLYRSYYCGLCCELKDSYGRAGQMTLSYDTTFLSFLLTSLYEPAEEDCGETRCIAHPFEDHPTRRNEFTRYCADINILLSYYSCLDDWEDTHSLKKRALATLLRGKSDRAAAKWKHKAEVVTQQLELLHQYEKERSTDIDLVSGTFGTLLAELFAYKEDVWEQTLRRMGFFLGKFIYILDAYDDLEEDRKNGAYNPLLAKSTEEGFDDWCRRILTMMMAECCSAFEMLPIVTNIEILRNILYAGVWTKYDAVRAAREGKNASEIAAQAAADGDSEGGADGTDSAAADSGAGAESSAADSGAGAESAAATDSDAAAEGSRQ